MFSWVCLTLLSLKLQLVSLSYDRPKEVSFFFADSNSNTQSLECIKRTAHSHLSLPTEWVCFMTSDIFALFSLNRSHRQNRTSLFLSSLARRVKNWEEKELLQLLREFHSSSSCSSLDTRFAVFLFEKTVWREESQGKNCWEDEAGHCSKRSNIGIIIEETKREQESRRERRRRREKNFCSSSTSSFPSPLHHHLSLHSSSSSHTHSLRRLVCRSICLILSSCFSSCFSFSIAALFLLFSLLLSSENNIQNKVLFSSEGRFFSFVDQISKLFLFPNQAPSWSPQSSHSLIRMNLFFLFLFLLHRILWPQTTPFDHLHHSSYYETVVYLLCLLLSPCVIYFCMKTK